MKKPLADNGVARRMTAWADHNGGAAAVEFAFLATFLVPLVIGVVDVGNLAYQSMQVRAAAQAGADYARINGYDGTTHGNIDNAVTSATTLAVTSTPTPTLATDCPNSGSNGLIADPSGTTCAAGDPPGNYVTVGAQATFTPIVPWSSYLLPSTITASATVRIN